MRRSIRILAVAAVAAAVLVPAGAQANHTCSSDTVIFSGKLVAGQRVGFVNSNAVICIVGSDAEDVYDGRIINPGSDAITVRHTTHYGEDVPTLTIQLDGLGYEGDAFEAPTVTTSTGSTLYQTGDIHIDPSLSGTITATVFVPGIDEAIDSVTFRTVDS